MDKIKFKAEYYTNVSRDELARIAGQGQGASPNLLGALCSNEQHKVCVNHTDEHEPHGCARKFLNDNRKWLTNVPHTTLEKCGPADFSMQLTFKGK